MNNIKQSRIISLLLLSVWILSGCSEDLKWDKTESNPPAITDFSPKSGKVGTEILVKGENLQKVTAVWIGETEAQLKYLVNSSELVAVVTAENKTGKIRVSNSEGDGESQETFTLMYVVPSIKSYPKAGSPNDEVLIEGENLDAATNVLFGTAKAEIKSRSEKELLVAVPYFEDSPVDIFVEYYDGTSFKTTGTTGKVFSLMADIPSVTKHPETAEAGSSITVYGTNLNLMDEAWFGNNKGEITQRTETYIMITVPEIEKAENVVFKLIYYGDKEMILSEEFQITIPVQTDILYWPDRTIYCQDPETTANFFDANTGRIYGPCDYEEKKNDIHFLLSITGGYIQLNNPNNSGNVTKLYRCGEEYLPTEKMPNIVKFRVLKTTSAADNKFIEMVKNQTLTEISEEILQENGLGNTSSNTPRYKESSGYEEGSVLLFKHLDAAGDVIKVGFIEITKVTTSNTESPYDDRTSSITFNCYYQK